MRVFALASVIVVMGCSGGGSKASAEQVDSASLDFCIDYGNGVCRLAYLCTDATAQNAAFHARYGSSMDDCWQGIQKLCTSNQSGSGAFGPSCGSGKTPNASAMTCIDGLDSQSCVDWMTTPAGKGCDGVCGGSAGGMNGAAGGSGTNTGGSGTAGSSSSSSGGSGSSSGGSSTGGSSTVTTETEYCTVRGEAQCDRYFECDPAGASAKYGNLAGCKGFIQATCPALDLCPVSFDATLASGCVAAVKAATCMELMGPAPEVCTAACQ